VRVALVIPTIGRPSLQRLLESLAASDGPRPAQLVVVDDRRPRASRLPGDPPLAAGSAAPGWTGDVMVLRRSGGRGPAAARNVGWQALDRDTDWVAFLDDDVLVSPTWLADLAGDLAAVEDGVWGVQGRVTVPLPMHRRPTDWERGTAGLAGSRWITADMAFRRSALVAVDGFDERFPRAFREDADLALRMLDAGGALRTGRRAITHPVRPAPWNASLSQQRGNADDALMRRLHGAGWYARAGATVGRRPVHLAVTAAALAAGALALGGRRRSAAAAAVAWAAGTGQFAWRRIAPGPRDAGEVARMLATSVAIPPAASWHWARGTLRHRGARPWSAAPRVSAVLVDRDGTIVQDVPYNSDPARVVPVPGAREALDRIRAAGLPVGVVSNQSGVARGLVDEGQLRAVNARVEELLGPFDVWQVCPHAAADRCRCRKPQPGLVLDAAAALGVPARRVAVIGDIGSDVAAAQAAGAVGVLVPTPATRPEEVETAPVVRSSLGAAVEHLLADRLR